MPFENIDSKKSEMSEISKSVKEALEALQFHENEPLKQQALAALKEGDASLIAVLSSNWASRLWFNTRADWEGKTFAHFAAARGDLHFVRELQRHGASADDLLMPDDGQCTPLHAAALHGHAAMMGLLLEALPDASARASALLAVDEDEMTPLHYAALRGDSAVLAELRKVSIPAKLLCAPNIQGVTPVHQAAHGGHAQFISELSNALHAEGEPAVQWLTRLDDSGCTPADLAERQGHLEVIRALRAAGVPGMRALQLRIQWRKATRQGTRAMVAPPVLLHAGAGTPSFGRPAMLKLGPPLARRANWVGTPLGSHGRVSPHDLAIAALRSAVKSKPRGGRPAQAGALS